VFGIPEFRWSFTDPASGFLQLSGIERFAALVALVSPGTGKTAIRAGPFYIPVRAGTAGPSGNRVGTCWTYRCSLYSTG